MKRNTAITAYRRVQTLEERRSLRLRESILLPYFGGCDCRAHNCIVNYESGVYESPVRGKNHAELAHIARRYYYEQKMIWSECGRLANHFAQSF